MRSGLQNCRAVEECVRGSCARLRTACSADHAVGEEKARRKVPGDSWDSGDHQRPAVVREHTCGHTSSFHPRPGRVQAGASCLPSPRRAGWARPRRPNRLALAAPRAVRMCATGRTARCRIGAKSRRGSRGASVKRRLVWTPRKLTCLLPSADLPFDERHPRPQLR